MNEFYEDKTITCRDCKQPFVFTGGEQRFFAERQFTEPNRCKPCRQAKKAAREQQQAANGGPPIQGYSAPPAQLDSASPRRPFVYEPGQDAQRFNGGGGAGAGKKRSGGGKRRRDEESGWGGDGYDD